MTTRNGKIAHLPRPLRDELNHRMDNGVPGHKLLAWLNTHPEVQNVLAEFYPGRRITQQNLSEWRQGGYQEWFKLQETHNLTLQFAKEPDTIPTGLSPGITPQKLVNALATITAAEYARTSQDKLRECTDTNERWKHVREMTTHVARLRLDDHRAATHAFNQKRLDHQIATHDRTLAATAQAEARRELLTRLEQLSEGRVPRVPNLPPPASNPTSCRVVALAKAENQAKNAQFPSGTDSNQPENLNTRTTSAGRTTPSEGRVLKPIICRVPNFPASAPDPSDASDRPEPTPRQTGNQDKNPQFPSETNSHQAQKISITPPASTDPDARKSNIANRKLETTNPTIQTSSHPTASTPIKPASHPLLPGKNQAKNPQFPSGTDRHQTQKISTAPPASTDPGARKSNIVNRNLETPNPTIHQPINPLLIGIPHLVSGPLKPTPKFLHHLASPVAATLAGAK